ncbi:hypothetical protein EAG14_22075 [Acidovorax sp. 1608163]|uniref:hypothetical protein n=1 Tax=Acidovorax sp. 1608163 TaxID=2478662 RepID=UPI000EF67A01|nr:hypothetical protein [Acidovorax sp. 1608163]AYM98314.1 hypothetical protein EAG14_22075 [Acidovorax sp. 1608163]
MARQPAQCALATRRAVRYTAAVMSFTPSSVIAPAATFACMGMMLPAFTRAMGARMMITITTAAT